MADINAKTLCFADDGVEQGFLASRRAKLAFNVFLGLGVVLLYLLATLVTLALQGWSTGGQVFAATSEGRRLAERRGVALMMLSGLVAMGMLITRISGRMRILTPRGFEIFTACFASIFFVGVTLQHPWYLAKLSGVAEPWSHVPDPFELGDDKLLLMLDIVLTGCHLMLPIRWICLWPAEVAAILCYAVPAFALGAPVPMERVPINILLMSGLVFTAAWGKRALEVHERVAFASLAAERTLRAEAEHRLHRATEAQQEAVAKPPEADASSLPTTGFTGSVFDLDKDGDADAAEDRLVKIMDLGFKEHWLVKAEALQPLHDRVLGAGGFGTTVVALYHGAEVVLKAPRFSERSQARNLLAAAGELRILRRLHHPNIVVFYGAWIDPGNSDIILVLEYIVGQELQAAISGKASTPHAVADRCILADNICSALRYLHAQVPIIIHGDIKSSNVLVEQLRTRRNAKLLDFGLSRLLTRRTRDLGGTLRWMAPEVIRRDSIAKAPSADVFSFGRLLYMIMTGRSPLVKVSAAAIREAASRDLCPDLDWPDEMPLLEQVKGLCDLCLEFDPAKRPSMAAAHASLRTWGSLPTTPGGVATALREAFPGQVRPSLNLHQALEHVRRGLPQSSKEAGAGQGRARERRSSRQPPQARQLTLPELEETPDASKLMSLACALTTWNVPLASDCCTKHALVRELRRMSLVLLSHPCKQAAFVNALQCPQCKLLTLVGGRCDMCPAESEGAQANGPERSARQAAIESLSEAPGEAGVAAGDAAGGGGGGGGGRVQGLVMCL